MLPDCECDQVGGGQSGYRLIGFEMRSRVDVGRGSVRDLGADRYICAEPGRVGQTSPPFVRRVPAGILPGGKDLATRNEGYERMDLRPTEFL
jgi:hypothetical protein